MRINKKMKWAFATISACTLISIPTSISLISCSNDKSSDPNNNSNDNDSLIDISGVNNQLQQKVNEKLLLAQNLTNQNDIDAWKNELIIDLNSILLNLGVSVEQITINFENGENGKQLISSIIIKFNKNVINGNINGNTNEVILENKPSTNIPNDDINQDDSSSSENIFSNKFIENMKDINETIDGIDQNVFTQAKNISETFYKKEIPNFNSSFDANYFINLWLDNANLEQIKDLLFINFNRKSNISLTSGKYHKWDSVKQFIDINNVEYDSLNHIVNFKFTIYNNVYIEGTFANDPYNTLIKRMENDKLEYEVKNMKLIPIENSTMPLVTFKIDNIIVKNTKINMNTNNNEYFDSLVNLLNKAKNDNLYFNNKIIDGEYYYELLESLKNEKKNLINYYNDLNNTINSVWSSNDFDPYLDTINDCIFSDEIPIGFTSNTNDDYEMKLNKTNLKTSVFGVVEFNNDKSNFDFLTQNYNLTSNMKDINTPCFDSVNQEQYNKIKLVANNWKSKIESINIDTTIANEIANNWLNNATQKQIEDMLLINFNRNSEIRYINTQDTYSKKYYSISVNSYNDVTHVVDFDVEVDFSWFEMYVDYSKILNHDVAYRSLRKSKFSFKNIKLIPNLNSNIPSITMDIKYPNIKIQMLSFYENINYNEYYLDLIKLIDYAKDNKLKDKYNNLIDGENYNKYISNVKQNIELMTNWLKNNNEILNLDWNTVQFKNIPFNIYKTPFEKNDTNNPFLFGVTYDYDDKNNRKFQKIPFTIPYFAIAEFDYNNSDFNIVLSK